MEVKLKYAYEKSREKAHEQLCGYMDSLGVSESWLVVVDSDLSKPWGGKLSTNHLLHNGKAIHVICC